MDDINQVRAVIDPQLSPDGEWVAYAVRTADTAKDKRFTSGCRAGTASAPSSSPTRVKASTRPAGVRMATTCLFCLARGEKDGPEHSGCSTGAAAMPAADALQRRRASTCTGRPTACKLALVVMDDPPRRQRGRRRGQDAASDRHRPLLLQGRRNRLSRARAACTCTCSMWRPGQGRGPDIRAIQRNPAVVAGRHRIAFMSKRARIPIGTTCSAFT